MSFLEFLLVVSMLLALFVLRIGVPCLCTWVAGMVMRRLTHQPEHA